MILNNLTYIQVDSNCLILNLLFPQQRTPRSTVSKSKGITSSASVSSASSVTSSSSTPPPPKGGAVATEETAEGAPKAEEEASKQQQQQQSPSSIASRKSHIADRLNSIMNNSEKWKTTIGKQNDSHQFTVKSKIAKRNTQHMNGGACVFVCGWF